jgi:hypothetical protein
MVDNVSGCLAQQRWTKTGKGADAEGARHIVGASDTKCREGTFQRLDNAQQKNREL